MNKFLDEGVVKEKTLVKSIVRRSNKSLQLLAVSHSLTLVGMAAMIMICGVNDVIIMISIRSRAINRPVPPPGLATIQIRLSFLNAAEKVKSRREGDAWPSPQQSYGVTETCELLN